MSEDNNSTSRRQFIKGAGAVVAASTLPSLAFPSVHSSIDDTIQVALVGCGGRGSGAASNAMHAKPGPLKVVAMADVFKDRLDSSHRSLKNDAEKNNLLMDVPEDRQFVGFDAYKKAMDCLRPGDIVILTTPPAFRWVHFQYAISKKLNVFMEKPVTVDGPTSLRMLDLAKQSVAAGLKVGVGLMSRHQKGLQELHSRVQDGELGDILVMRGYRVQEPAGDSELIAKPDNVSHLEFQIRHFHAFLWASGGCYNDFYIHHVDHLSWMKNAWPVSAQGMGGKHYRFDGDGKEFIDQNFDVYVIEYTFADGTKMYFEGRCMNNVKNIYSSYLHGTKGSAIAARNADCNGPAAIFRGHVLPDHLLPEEAVAKANNKPIWTATDRTNPYQNEWDALVTAIKNNKPHNEVERGVYASVSSSMARMAAHTGQLITFDQMLHCTHEFAPMVDKLDYNSDAPVMPGANGKYPVPNPGITVEREY